MKQMTKGIVLSVVLLILFCVMLPGGVIQAAFSEKVTIVATGPAGPSATWTYTSDGTMTISGTGETESGYSIQDEWRYFEPPWTSMRYHGNASVGEVKKIVFEEGITSIDQCFCYGESVEILVLPDSVKVIREDAFSRCFNLKTIFWGNGVETIEAGAFSQCSALVKTGLPESLLYIGENAFRGCGMCEITVSDKVCNIGCNAFQSSKLEQINVSPENKDYSSVEGVLFSKDGSTLLSYPAGNLNTKYVIPDGTKVIASNAFCGADNLRELEISFGVEEVQEAAFCDMSQLKNVYFPDSVMRMGNPFFFEGAYVELEDLILPLGVREESRLEWSVSEKAEARGSFFPEGYYEIPEYYSAENIGLRYCRELYIPASCQTELTQTLLHDLDKLVVVYGYRGTLAEDIANSYKIPLIEPRWMQTEECSVTIEKVAETNEIVVTCDGYRLLEGRDYCLFTNKTDGIIMVRGLRRFKGVICASVESIPSVSSEQVCPYESFELSEEEKKEIIASGTCGEEVFWNLTAGGTLTISGKGAINVSYNDAWKRYQSSIRRIRVENGVTVLSSYAFYNCESLEEVWLPQSLEKIEAGAFSDCKKLQKVDFSGDQVTIAGSVFSNCDSLEEIAFPDNYDLSNAYRLFFHCKNLEKVQLPKSMTVIPGGICEGCPKLTEVVIPSSVTEIGSWAFISCKSLKSVEVPSATTTIGKMAFGYYKPKNESIWTVYEDFILCGAKGSAAETYAKKNGISFASVPMTAIEIKNLRFDLSRTSYTYGNRVWKPAVTVKNGNSTLAEGTDFTVTYKNCKNVGNAFVVINGIGKYTGSKTLSYKINPPATTLTKLTPTTKGFTATIKKQATQTTGYQLRYSTKKDMSGSKTVTITKNSSCTKKITKLSRKKKYYVQVRTYTVKDGKKYYSAWSTAKSVVTK